MFSKEWRSAEGNTLCIQRRNKSDVPIAVQCIEKRKVQIACLHHYRFDTYEGRNRGESEQLPFGMSMIIRRGMRVDQHHPVDVVHMREHCYTHLIGKKQCQQEQRKM